MLSRHRAAAGLLTVSFLLVACGEDDPETGAAEQEATSTPASESGSPSAAVTPQPVADPLNAYLECMTDAFGSAPTPSEDPRFGALAEFQNAVGAFVYATVEDAEAAVPDLEAAGSTATEVVGTVVISGEPDPAFPEEAETAEQVRACAAQTVDPASLLTAYAGQSGG